MACDAVLPLTIATEEESELVAKSFLGDLIRVGLFHFRVGRFHLVRF